MTLSNTERLAMWRTLMPDVQRRLYSPPGKPQRIGSPTHLGVSDHLLIAASAESALKFQTIVKRNVMGGGNVIVLPANVGPLYGGTFHVASYATMSNARRAVRSGAAVRRAIAVESGS